MPKQQLPRDVVIRLLDDAKRTGFSRVRFYGGEPLAHKDLPAFVTHAKSLGLKFWITTNGLLLRKKIDRLYEAGARDISLGYYGGSPEVYDEYVARPGAHKAMEEGVAYLRAKYGKSIHLHLDWVLMRPTSSVEAIRAMWEFAEKYDAPIGVNLVHYSLPYFLNQDDPGWSESRLTFDEEDRELLLAAVEELNRLRATNPRLLPQPPLALRSIPDWLIKKQAMRVPCMSRHLIWVGADGSVQQCYVTFKLGNLYQNSLAEMLFTDSHKRAAVDAFKLNCPNCNCGFDSRVMAHGPSYKRYSNGSWAE